MSECYNTNTVALNIGLTILDVGSKYGPYDIRRWL